MKLFDFTVDDLESGLHSLQGDVHINEMCEHLLRKTKLVDEIHIYVEHVVDVPVPGSDEREPHVKQWEVEVSAKKRGKAKGKKSMVGVIREKFPPTKLVILERE
ncbi:hypothetical protein PIB30_043314 [Stylosanthes scabra]|uniref:Uncharacterized protein n=1 Tax=Stylosanthes scabra TaxID=79078 RepID=A0ABU6QFI5_9FABA|nr:hypothetical protein [Stylosanthes scabra]